MDTDELANVYMAPSHVVERVYKDILGEARVCLERFIVILNSKKFKNDAKERLFRTELERFSSAIFDNGYNYAMNIIDAAFTAAHDDGHRRIYEKEVEAIRKTLIERMKNLPSPFEGIYEYLLNFYADEDQAEALDDYLNPIINNIRQARIANKLSAKRMGIQL
jgi:hypothetical protein